MTSITDTAPAPGCAAEPMQYDVVIAGAGLHGGLIALALLCLLYTSDAADE